MKTNTLSAVEASFRTYYGKLFSALLRQFGAKYVNEIEDAIQNSFYKSLKSWKPNQTPSNPENWLFMVAKNDILNQIKRQSQLRPELLWDHHDESENLNKDLRLKTILFFIKSQKVSSKVKVIFILKNIFGLHIKEISACTLLSQDAVYKSINRAKKDFQVSIQDIPFDAVFEQISENEITLIEEILYAVFNIGFDSFSEKVELVVNEDLCLEALAITKMLWSEFKRVTTKNLLSLFSFHLARIPEKVKEHKIIPFFEQDKSKWNQEFIQLGFHYLEKPQVLNKYYLEALITSKHMTVARDDHQHWNSIVKLYELMLPLSNSPIMKLNLCHCLNKANRTKDAMNLLETIEKELPEEHIYLSLVKANMLKGKATKESEKLIHQALKNITQKIRSEYILENISADL